MIPMSLRLVVQEENSKGVNLWLPLFLLWILLLPPGILLLGVWFCSRLVSGRIARILEAAAAVIWNMNGLQVNIRNRKSCFVLHF